MNIKSVLFISLIQRVAFDEALRLRWLPCLANVKARGQRALSKLVMPIILSSSEQLLILNLIFVVAQWNFEIIVSLRIFFYFLEVYKVKLV